jgi:PAS domain S-box-containing protein
VRTGATDRQTSSIFERVALGGASATVLISVLGLLGWGLGLPALTSIRPGYVPIALSTCIALLIQGTILIVYVQWPSHARRWPLAALAAATAIFAILAFAGAFVHLDMTFEGALLPSDVRFAQFPVDRMSPFTGMLVFSTGIALFLLLLHKNQKLIPHLAAGLAGLAALAGLIGTVGYAYGTPLLYGGTVIPMALTTSAAFMFLGTGLAAAAGPSAFFIEPLTGGSVRAMLLRTFVPLAFIAVIGSDIFQRLVTRLNSALVSAASAVFFGMATIVIVVQAARRIGRIIDKTEAERALAEKELLRAKQDWERTFDSVPDLIAILDVKHRITRLNKAMADRLGLAAGQCIGESCYKLVHGAQGAPAFCPHVLSCRDGQEHVAEVYEPRLGGHFQISTTPIFDEQRRPVGIVHVARDITRHKEADEALQREHDRVNAIVEFLPDATFVIDISGKVIAWNRAIEEMTGVSKADMLQKADYEYAVPFYGERRPILIDLILKPDSEFESSKYDYVQRHGDLLFGETYTPQAFKGKGAHIWSAASVLRDSSGNAVGAIQSLRDITERKRAEEERLRLEQQLLQVQKAESLGRMAGAIAHNFNNKLMVVIGNLELALGVMPQESAPRARVLQAMNASQQAAEISRLMLACIGQTSVKVETLYLAETIRETLPPLTASLPQNVHLKTDITLQGPIVLADPVHIKQILTNLVLNASEAIGDQEGDISVAIREMLSAQVRESRVFPPEWEPKAERYVCLSVSDNGCGLDAATQEKIFDPFFSTKFIGRGLGLSVVLGLVRAYEGAIAVESRMGLGTTFRVFFPLPENP